MINFHHQAEYKLVSEKWTLLYILNIHGWVAVLKVVLYWAF